MTPVLEVSPAESVSASVCSEGLGAGVRVAMQSGALGINGDSIGVDPDQLAMERGLSRDGGEVVEEGGERVVVGIGGKRKKGVEKSKSKRQRMDSRHGHHPRHPSTDSVLSSASPSSVSSSSVREIGVPHTAGPPGYMHAALTPPIPTISALGNSRVSSLGTIGSSVMRGDMRTVSSVHRSVPSSFQSGNGLPTTSHSDIVEHGGGGTRHYQNIPVYASEGVRVRAGQMVQTNVTTPTSQVITPGGHVATPIHHLATSSTASGINRLAPEFGHIRVKVEPGLSNHDTNKSSINKVSHLSYLLYAPFKIL